jgi:hypothetical protein
MVLGLLNIAGALSLLLGLLFTIPISILASVIVYEQLVQAPELISTSSAAPQPAPIN